MRNVRIYAREIIATEGSKISFITPDWEQEFSPIGLENNGDGANGGNGNNGEAGPQGESGVQIGKLQRTKESTPLPCSLPSMLGCCCFLNVAQTAKFSSQSFFKGCLSLDRWIGRSIDRCLCISQDWWVGRSIDRYICSSLHPWVCRSLDRWIRRFLG